MRVVDEKGGQLGVMSLGEALFRSRQKGLDLVEVAANATPPVCKIINFKKFLYQEEKKDKAGRKKAKKQETKEIRFTPFIAQNDFNIRINKAKDFLAEGNRVKLSVKFMGRQITRKEFGYELLNKASIALKDVGQVEDQPKWLGKILLLSLKPIKNKI